MSPPSMTLWVKQNIRISVQKLTLSDGKLFFVRHGDHVSVCRASPSLFAPVSGLGGGARGGGGIGSEPTGKQSLVVQLAEFGKRTC